MTDLECSKPVPEESITAVIPTFNRVSKIVFTLESVMAQSSPPDEIIIVDDASTDGTVELVRKRFGHAVQVIVHECNQGVGGARRTGF